jgi:hypothetical protein
MKKPHDIDPRLALSKNRTCTKELVSMDQFKEMIDIEREFGSCLKEPQVKHEKYVDNSLWVPIYQSLHGSAR